MGRRSPRRPLYSILTERPESSEAFVAGYGPSAGTLSSLADNAVDLRSVHSIRLRDGAAWVMTGEKPEVIWAFFKVKGGDQFGGAGPADAEGWSVSGRWSVGGIVPDGVSRVSIRLPDATELASEVSRNVFLIKSALPLDDLTLERHTVG